MECESVIQGLLVYRKELRKFGIHVARVALLKVGVRENANDKNTQWEGTAALSICIVSRSSHLQFAAFPRIRCQSNYIAKRLIQRHDDKYPSGKSGRPIWKFIAIISGFVRRSPVLNIKTSNVSEILVCSWCMFRMLCAIYYLDKKNTRYISSNVYFVKYSDMFLCIYSPLQGACSYIFWSYKINKINKILLVLLICFN
jgi:hypothetical protein